MGYTAFLLLLLLHCIVLPLPTRLQGSAMFHGWLLRPCWHAAQVWGQKSSGAVPFGTLFALCFLWFCISTPLVFVGSYFGYKKPAAEDPVRTNKIPRQIPDQVCAFPPWRTLLHTPYAACTLDTHWTP